MQTTEQSATSTNLIQQPQYPIAHEAMSRRERRAISGKNEEWEMRKKAAAEAAEQTAKKTEGGLIELSKGQEFVIILGCRYSDLPSSIPIKEMLPSVNGDPAQNRGKNVEVARFSEAKVSFAELIKNFSVISVEATACNRCLTVFINCTAGVGNNPAFSNRKTGSDCRQLVQTALSQVWKTAIMRKSDNKISMNLRRVSSNGPSKRIRFAVK